MVEDRHRKVRRLWRRARCVCGLAWPCPDRALALNARRQRATDRNTGAWGVQQTAAYPMVGRAGHLTRAQSYRAGGGRR